MGRGLLCMASFVLIFLSVCIGNNSYKIAADQDQIRAEIMQYGPIEAEFIVYDDFLSYKSGELWFSVYICFTTDDDFSSFYVSEKLIDAPYFVEMQRN